MIRYGWASPASLLGLAIAGLALLAGGGTRASIVGGVVEVHGRGLAWALRALTPWCGGAAAVTLGHVVLARDERWLEDTRAHERVHVEQYERWGPLFIPAYLAAGAWAWLRGRDAYYDNPFERDAFGAE